MKIIFLFIAVGTLFSPAAFSESAVASMAAFKSAWVMKQMQAPKDFEMLPVAADQKKMVSSELQRLDKTAFERAEISMPSATSVLFKFPSRSVLVDYQKIDQSVLIVDGRSIKLETFKTILNYKNEIESGFKKPARTALGFFIPTARADAISKAEDWVSFHLGANARLAHEHFLTFDNMKKPRESELEAELIRTYETDSKFHNVLEWGGDGKENKNYVAMLPVFSCANGKLARLHDVVLESDKAGAVSTVISALNPLTKTASGYRYAPNCWTVDMDDSFHIKSARMTGRCTGGGGSDQLPPVGSDFLTQKFLYQAYGQFPAIANACCAKKGCSEKVANAINEMVSRNGKVKSGSSVH